MTHPDLDEAERARREALAPDQEVYLRPRTRHLLEVLVPRVLAELRRRRDAAVTGTGEP